ncbi:hypothetical protein PSP20601_05531 [Pandoraea sputorum]|nr:hypothetical protein PSP20601_05531 [Pandoraea sputorum]
MEKGLLPASALPAPRSRRARVARLEARGVYVNAYDGVCERPFGTHGRAWSAAHGVLGR